MSDNSSSSSALFLGSLNFVLSHCFGSTEGFAIFASFTVSSSVLIVPLSVMVLLLGHQRWRRKSPPLTSHSDFFTYHLLAMELIFLLAAGSYCLGYCIDDRTVMVMASCVFYSSSCGQMTFHTLTCVERYLAVVHPISYMRMSKGRGENIRNIIILCVWFFGLAQLITMTLNSLDVTIIMHTAQQVFFLVVISFCSLAVLRALKRPGPGDGSVERERVDQVKKRAFNTITAIMGTLFLSFGGFVFSIAVYTSPYISKTNQCLVLESSYWLRLPSSVVVPLLFLHRAGKLTCGGNTAELREGTSSCCRGRKR